MDKKWKYQELKLGKDILNSIDEFKNKYINIEKIRNDYNKRFIEIEKINYKNLFDNIEGRALDQQQRECAIKEEINNLVIAGAGTVKKETEKNMDVMTFHKLGKEIIAEVEARQPSIIQIKLINLIEEEFAALTKNNESYNDGIRWKRETHKKYNTKLIETYSYEKMEGNLLEKLEKQLKDAGVIFIKKYVFYLFVVALQVFSRKNPPKLLGNVSSH
ncbi:hypothetical protein [Clostridium tagluense]|uniref:hypothetical protein n=1 Tax=Clostridium tagluense TaxID=360422 RepID=UPI001CF51401|nr:hypothetical protein [Clostridium tagluense]MCB2298615.1 hypothetical protein [Clostridium tagluense]